MAWEDCTRRSLRVPHTAMEKRSFSPLWLLLLLPYVGLLWIPFYNFKLPEFLGFPFFYWYQLAWVPLTSLLIFIVYRSVGDDE